MANGLGVSDRLFNSFSDLPAGAINNYEKGVTSGRVKMNRDQALDYANKNPSSVLPRGLQAKQQDLTARGWDANRVVSRYTADPLSTLPADMRAKYQSNVAAGNTQHTPESAARYYWDNYAAKQSADNVVKQAEQKARTAVGPTSAIYSADTRAVNADANVLSERNSRAQQQLTGWQSNEAMRNSDPAFASLSDAYMKQGYSPTDARAQATLDRQSSNPDKSPYTAQELGGVSYDDHFDRYARNLRAKPTEPQMQMSGGKLVSTGKTRAQTIYDNTLSRGDTTARRMNSDLSDATVTPVDLSAAIMEGGLDPVNNPKEFEARMDKLATDYTIYRKGMGPDAKLDYSTFIDVSLNPEHYGQSDIAELESGKQRIRDERAQKKSEMKSRSSEWRQNAFDRGQFQQSGAIPNPQQQGMAGGFFPQQASNGAAFNPQSLQSVAQQMMPGLNAQQTQALISQLVPVLMQQMAIQNSNALFLQQDD